MSDASYEMIVWWSNEDDAYVVEVPELPGCMAHGDTRANAVAEAEQAIALWIEAALEAGRSVPQPRGRLAYA